MKHLFILMAVSILCISAVAQDIPESKPQDIPDVGDNSGLKTKSRSDSLKMTIANIRNAFGNLTKFFLPKRDTTTIMIANIDYDNSNLALLKENLKKLKGVSSVLMHYKLSTAIMEIFCKSKALDLWDKLPVSAKQAFKILEANDNNIILKYKLAK